MMCNVICCQVAASFLEMLVESDLGGQLWLAIAFWYSAICSLFQASCLVKYVGINVYYYYTVMFVLGFVKGTVG